MLFARVIRVVTGSRLDENFAMLRFQSYKFELRPTGTQQIQMRRIAGCCRFVFNRALAIQIERRDQRAAPLDNAALNQQLAQWRRQPESAWLADVPAECLQRSLRNLEGAFARYRSSQSQYPTFKRRGRSDSFYYAKSNEVRVDQPHSRLLLPSLGWIRYRNSRAVPGRIASITISAAGNRWFVSILTGREVAPQVARGPAVGIDMGVVRFATLSNGAVYTPLNSFKRHEKALAVAQRSFSRKIKYSNNWRKERNRVQRIHIRIGNTRRDYLHKISTTISQNHAVVCIEDLRVSDMSRSRASNAGHTTSAAPGKRRLNKSILDQGWFEFRRQLEYKLKWNGGRLIAVSPRNTSITCPPCRHIDKANRVSQSQFQCVACGFQENADLVGALNVLRAGHARLACAETSPAYEGSGQEPTDALSQEL